MTSLNDIPTNFCQLLFFLTFFNLFNLNMWNQSDKPKLKDICKATSLESLKMPMLRKTKKKKNPVNGCRYK